MRKNWKFVSETCEKWSQEYLVSESQGAPMIPFMYTIFFPYIFTWQLTALADTVLHPCFDSLQLKRVPKRTKMGLTSIPTLMPFTAVTNERLRSQRWCSHGRKFTRLNIGKLLLKAANEVGCFINNLLHNGRRPFQTEWAGLLGRQVGWFNSPVWPDWAIFRRFGKSFKSLRQFLRLHLYFGKILNQLWPKF